MGARFGFRRCAIPLLLKDQPSPSLVKAFTASRFTPASDALGTNHPTHLPTGGANSVFAARQRISNLNVEASIKDPLIC